MNRLLLMIALVLASLAVGFADDPVKKSPTQARPHSVSIYLDHLDTPYLKTLRLQISGDGCLRGDDSPGTEWPDTSLEMRLGQTPAKAVYSHVSLWLDHDFEAETPIATLPTALGRIQRASNPESVKAIVVHPAGIPLPEP
jgi:hypothetical protein